MTGRLHVYFARLYPAAALECWLARAVLGGVRVFFVQDHVTFRLVVVFFPTWVPFVPFSCTNRASVLRLNKSGKSGLPRSSLTLLRGKALSFSLSRMITVGTSQVVSVMLGYVPPVIRVLITKGC